MLRSVLLDTAFGRFLIVERNRWAEALAPLWKDARRHSPREKQEQQLCLPVPKEPPSEKMMDLYYDRRGRMIQVAIRAENTPEVSA